MKPTILHDIHLSLGARMAPFGGFDMPIQYSGIVEEHMATRNAATIFDTCHMGEFRIRGPRALGDLERLITSDVGKLKPGRCRNGFFCNSHGGVVDDLIVYRMGEDDFMIVVNAGTQDADFEWVKQHLSQGTSAENVSERTSKIDLQGPGAPRILQPLVDRSLLGMKAYDHAEMSLAGMRVLVSRTGYTGEIGFEIYSETDDCAKIWRMFMDKGALPAGLGARDTLRLEMCYPLYGHELDAQRNVAESGFERLVSSSKEFIGSAAVRDTARSPQRLVALELVDRRSARAGDLVVGPAGETIGKVTSGSFAPSLGKAIALAYVTRTRAALGSRLAVRTARGDLSAEVVGKPFYKEATCRKEMSDYL